MANVFVFIPSFRGNISSLTFETSHRLMSTLASKGITSSVATYSWPDIAELRNMVTSFWYDTVKDSTHLLFVDDDMGFAPEVVLDMLALNEPVVGVVYPKKTTPREWVGSGIGAGEYRRGFIEVEGVGAGVLLIQREAISRMIERYPELIVDHMSSGDMRAAGATRTLEFFDCLKTPTGKVSEDLSFCRRWGKIGGIVWASTAYEIQHVGPWTFAGCFAKERDAEKKVWRDNFRFVEAKHGGFMVNDNDTFIGRSLLEYGEWCEFEIDLLSTVVKPGDTVIDAGANIGTHALAFSKMVGPDGRVLAFEPQSRLLKLLQENVERNLCSVEIKQCALGAVAGTIPMADLPPDDQPFNFGAVPLSAPAPSGGQTTVVTIDSLGLNPSLIKIDVEGMESDVIRGAIETIKRCEPVIYLECNGDDTSAVAIVLAEIGYRAYWSIGPYFNPNNFFGSKLNLWPGVMPSVNLIAVPFKRMPMLDLPPYYPGTNWRAVTQSIDGSRKSA
jgi:FkbM family methyltransferase